MKVKYLASKKGVPMGAPSIEPGSTCELDARGYVTDVPYIRTFIASLTPALLDHVALLAGFSPPSRETHFTYCDLGCGQGVTASLLAAIHPRGVFHGVDIIPGHIEHARGLCQEAGISNATFHQADFASTAIRGLPQFDYIVCHGVYTWVNADVQRDLRAFIRAHLKPGGLAYLSYNAMPGWAGDLAFQYLARALGRTLPGDSQSRMCSGLEVLQAMVAAKVPALTESVMLKGIQANPGQYSHGYLAHEYMNADWRPLFVTEVREAMSSIGLMPVGSATLMANFDSYVLGSRAREMLASISDPNVRELVRDYYVSQRFRRDVFVRDGQRISAEEQRRRLLESTFSLMRPPQKVVYSVGTPAGTLHFDNETARAMVGALAEGVCRLTDLSNSLGLDEQDVLANALSLSAAGILTPVESTAVSVISLNQVLLARAAGPEPVEALALPSGTGVGLKLERMKRLFEQQHVKEIISEDSSNHKLSGSSAIADDFLAWRTFLQKQRAISGHQ